MGAGVTEISGVTVELTVACGSLPRKFNSAVE
jgi:hypothetical protein